MKKYSIAYVLNPKEPDSLEVHGPALRHNANVLNHLRDGATNKPSKTYKYGCWSCGEELDHTRFRRGAASFCNAECHATWRHEFWMFM